MEEDEDRRMKHRKRAAFHDTPTLALSASVGAVGSAGGLGGSPRQSCRRRVDTRITNKTMSARARKRATAAAVPALAAESEESLPRRRNPLLAKPSAFRC